MVSLPLCSPSDEICALRDFAYTITHHIMRPITGIDYRLRNQNQFILQLVGVMHPIQNAIAGRATQLDGVLGSSLNDEHSNAIAVRIKDTRRGERRQCTMAWGAYGSHDVS